MQQAANWVRALTLLRFAYASSCGLPTQQLVRLKAAFKVAARSSGKETLSLSQQQNFFAAVNLYPGHEGLRKLHARAQTAADGVWERPGSWQYMLALYVLATRVPAIENLFHSYANWGMGGDTISLEDFKSFWRECQP